MKCRPCRLSLVLMLGALLPPGPAAAWTEEDLQAADRLLERRLERRWAAEADAQDQAAATAMGRTEAAIQADTQARLGRRQAIDALEGGLVQIPGGSFDMGCGPGDGRCEDDEKPVHWVTIQPFRIGRDEVTQAQWAAVMGANPAQNQDDRRPVEMVSWDDVQKFIKRLNSEAGDKTFRLPSEAEWEYAARARTETAWWWGAEVGRGNANCADCGGPAAARETAPTGSFTPNAFGLRDTAGNVAEWVQDCYHETYAGAPTDGTAWGGPCPGGYRVMRGGSWFGSSGLLRSADRQHGWPSDRSGDRGFRLAQ